jgi:peptidoglycan/LPS O-acetylase OafA/YrhL
LLSGIGARITSAILVAGIVCVAGPSFIMYFGVWLIGAGLNTSMIASRRGLRLRWAMVLFVFALTLFRLFKVYFYHDSVPQIPQACLDYGLGIVTFLLIDAILRDNRTNSGGLYKRLANQLSRMSYTLYAIHTPLVVFFTAMLVGDSTKQWIPDIVTVGKAGGVLLFILLCAHAWAWLFEDRTETIRQGVIKLLTDWKFIEQKVMHSETAP